MIRRLHPQTSESYSRFYVRIIFFRAKKMQCGASVVSVRLPLDGIGDLNT